MRIHLPATAHLQNIDPVLRSLDLTDDSRLQISSHPRWVTVHPVVLTMAAALAANVRAKGGTVSSTIPNLSSVPYLVRLGLFRELGVEPPRTIKEHEESGRFIPLTRITSAEALTATISDLVPLLHCPPRAADPIRYVFSELVRNVFEHAGSPIGAYVCAQYYSGSRKISIGVTDLGIGVQTSMAHSHSVPTPRSAITLAMRPGITGTTRRIGGTETNAGAGLFFTKSIARYSRNHLLLYSGDAAFKLLRGSKKATPELHADPAKDPHKFIVGLPSWPGTVVGIDLSVPENLSFADLLESIRAAFFPALKAQRKAYYKRVRFTS